MKIYNKIIVHCLFIVLLSIGKSASALPIAIDNCISSGDCVYQGIDSAFDIDGNAVVAHNILDIRNGTLDFKVLMEYQLGTTSRIDTVGFDYDTYETLPLQTTAITGSLWLELSRSYDLSNSMHELTLYFEDAMPSEVPQGVWSNYEPYTDHQNLMITTEGLLAGFGETFAQCCDFPGPPSPSPFSSTAESNPSLFDGFGNYPLLCLAEGCYAGAMLNLLGLEYVDSGTLAQLTYNPDEVRSLLYYSASGYEGYSNNTYSLSSVPVPAAVWLFGSGLMALLGFMGRKKSI